MFATIYTLTNNRRGDTTVRMAVLKVVLEFLQASKLQRNSSTGSAASSMVPACCMHFCICTAVARQGAQAQHDAKQVQITCNCAHQCAAAMYYYQQQ
jgi:hypothetical protein